MKPMKSILTAIGVAGLAAGMAFAQAPQGAPAAGHPHRMEARHAMRRKMMIGYLGLTDQQQTQAKAIFSSAHESAQPLRQQLKEVRTELRAAIQAGQPVNDLAANQGKLRGQLVAIRANAAEQFRGLLTPAQLQKLQELHVGGRRNSQGS
jgi:protein CpxP